jgi:thiamine pyrophosphokinase
MQIQRFKHMEDVDAVILAAGNFPAHPLPRAALARYRECIFCCDGAADTLLAAGYFPVVTVGDGDSLSPAARTRLAGRLIEVPEQESNDLTKTVQYCVTTGLRRLLILGATGKREDHTLGNISLLADYMDAAEVEMWTDYGILTPSQGEVTFESFPGQQISVFAMDPEPLTLRGLRWPVERRILTRWWQASLNEATGMRFSVRSEGKTVVFRQWREDK